MFNHVRKDQCLRQCATSDGIDGALYYIGGAKALNMEHACHEMTITHSGPYRKL